MHPAGARSRAAPADPAARPQTCCGRCGHRPRCPARIDSGRDGRYAAGDGRPAPTGGASPHTRMRAMAELPSGTVTFLFTDIEGSTALWERHPAAMGPVLARHESLLRETIAGR